MIAVMIFPLTKKETKGRRMANNIDFFLIKVKLLIN